MDTPETPAAEPNPALTGPYDAEAYGRCADGHPVNQFGRCAVVNGEP